MDQRPLTHRFKALFAAALVIIAATLVGCLNPSDPGPGYSSMNIFPKPTGIYYHVKVDASAAQYYWQIWNATQDIYNLTGIVLYVDPPNTPASAAPGSFNIRALGGVEAHYCGTAGIACALPVPDGQKIVGGTMLLNIAAIAGNPEGVIRHEFGHLLGLNHYPYYLMSPVVPNGMHYYGPGDILGLYFQRDQGRAVWGV